MLIAWCTVSDALYLICGIAIAMSLWSHSFLFDSFRRPVLRMHWSIAKTHPRHAIGNAIGLILSRSNQQKNTFLAKVNLGKLLHVKRITWDPMPIL